jgi:HEAT repeat protein
MDALGAIGPAAEPAVSKLTEHLRTEKDEYRRVEAAQALGRIGAPAKSAVPQLRAVVKEEKGLAHVWAAAAIAQITGDYEGALPIMVETLRKGSAKAEDFWMMDAALKALEQFGPHALPAVPSLIEALKEERNLGSLAARALGAIGPDAKTAVPRLAAVLDDEEREKRQAACEALGRIGASAVSAVPSLVELWQNDDERSVRTAAAEALKKIDLEAAAKAGVK